MPQLSNVAHVILACGEHAPSAHDGQVQAGVGSRHWDAMGGVQSWG